MTDTQEREALAGASRGYYKIPDARKRAAMTPEEVAIEISKSEKDSPSYIVLSHELNLKLAKEQAKATLSAGWLGAGATLLAVFISAGLGYLAGTKSKETNNSPGARQVTQPAASTSGSKSVAVRTASAAFPKAVEVPAVGGNAQHASNPGDSKAKKP